MKESANKGRKFYSCSKGQDGGCGFFEWADQAPTGSTSKPRVPSKRPATDQAVSLDRCPLLCSVDADARVAAPAQSPPTSSSRRL